MNSDSDRAGTAGGDVPAVDVILPTLNCAAALRRCLTAVGSQRFPGTLRLTVVDGGSTDATPTVAREFGATLYINPGQYGTGLSGGRRFGEERTSAPFVWLLDADNVPTTGEVLGRLLRPLLSEPAVQLTVPTLEVSAHQSSFSRWLAAVEQYAIEGEIARGRGTPHGVIVDPLEHGVSNGSVVRRAALERAGGYDSDVRLLDRLRRLGLARAVIVPDARIVHDQADDVFHYARKAARRLSKFGRMTDEDLRRYFVDYPVPADLDAELHRRFQGGFVRAPGEGLAGWRRTRDPAWLWGLVYPGIVVLVSVSQPRRAWRVYRRFL